jgi:L-lactate dehydrogenase (cytochrome)
MSAVASAGARLGRARRRRERSHRVPKYLRDVLDLDGFERAARLKLPHAVYGYVAHGAETETTLRTNRTAFDAWRLITRVLVGVSERHQDIQLFGRRYAAPFGIAPMGGSALVAYKGHTVMAKAAAEARFRSSSAPTQSFLWKR